MNAIAREWHTVEEHVADVLHLRHHTSDPSASSQPEEQPMTTPPQSVVDSLHAITGELAANPLIRGLVQYGIGKHLTPAQADHFVTVINDQEQANAQVERLNAQVAAQAQQHDDSAQFPADGQPHQ